MKKVYETPMTEVYVVEAVKRLCEVIDLTGAHDDFTNERNDVSETQGEDIWNKEW